MAVSSAIRRCEGCGATLSRYNDAKLCASCGKKDVRPGRPAPTVAVARTKETWLYVGHAAVAPPDDSAVGDLMRAYRAAHHLTQTELAAKLGFDPSYISYVETGKRKMRDIDQLRRVAAVLDIPEEELGLLPVPGDPAVNGSADGSAVGSIDVSANADDPSAESQRDWRRVRRLLNQHRNELSASARRLYPKHGGVQGVISRPDWIGHSPIPLDQVKLSWLGKVEAPRIVGSEPQSEDIRPVQATGTRFERYSRAIKAIERPTLFENRVSYRLANVEWGDDSAHLGFGYTTYFDMVDVCEAVAHEYAASWNAFGRKNSWLSSPAWTRLPLRSMVHDPFDLSARALLPSIDTLTIRRSRSGPSSFLLHQRNAAHVAVAGGYYHVMPCGVFQPSTLAPWDQANDFDLWRNMMREYSEEFLGMSEADGSSGEPIDYRSTEPFRSLNEAKASGALKAHCFGIGLDPLTLAGEILTVTVIDDDVYDDIFAGLVATNSEGAVVSASSSLSEGIAFTEENVRRLLDEEPLAPAAAACIDLAWQHSGMLLD